MCLFKKRISFQVFLILSVFMGLLCFISFIFFDLGLKYDGSYYLFLINYYENFSFSEISRQTFHFFQQLPVWLFLNGTESNSLSLLIKVYSFGLIYIHILSLLICYFILPSHRKFLFFFPLFAFFTGPLVSLSISVSVALSVCSYLWAVAFTICYSDLSLKSHKVLLIISILPLFQSHELMSYMSLFFIGLCLLKYKKEKELLNRNLILICIAFFIFLFIIHIFDLFYLQENMGREKNRNSFWNSLIHFKFLFFNSTINRFVLISILLKIWFLIEVFIKRNKIYYFLVLFLSLLFLKFLFSLNFDFNSYFSSRIFPLVISLPFCFLIWMIYEKKIKSWEVSNSFLVICFFGFVSLTFYRIQSDFYFFKHRKSISNSLSKCQGVLKYSNYESYFKDDMGPHWNTVAKSILYPKKESIYTILINDGCTIHRCEKDWSKAECKSYCDMFNAYFPNRFLEPDFKLEQRFFNFNPLYKAYQKGISTCSNTKNV